MDKNEVIAKLEEYQAVVLKYIPEECDTEQYRRPVRAAALETLVMLEGDEGKFKECLDIASKINPGMGWTGYDEFNYQGIISTMTAAAYLLKR